MKTERQLSEIERAICKIMSMADEEFKSDEDGDLEQWSYYDEMTDKVMKLVDEIRTHEYNSGFRK